MSDKNKYDDLFQNEEELFKRFLEKESIPKETSLQSENSKPPAKSDRGKNIYEEMQELESEEFEPDDLIDSPKDLLPDLSELFSDDAKKLGALKRIGLFFSLISGKENSKRLSALVIMGFLLLVLLLNIFTPSDKMSEKENRVLAQFPDFSVENVMSGKFMKNFESYVSDQFVFRNQFVSAKRSFEQLSGKEENHGILICDDGYLIENSSTLTNANTSSNIDGINALAAVGRYNVKVAVVPTAYEVMKDKLPDYAYVDVYGKLQKKLSNNITNAEVIDTNPVLKANKDKYLYYRSDHHQTALGSYYLYTALAPYLGIEAHPLESFAVEKVSDSFCGTAWSNSGFAPTKNDSVFKYTLDDSVTFTVSFPSENRQLDSLYNDEMLTKKDKYAYYLDGNHGLTVITSNAETGKKLAIIKDSYAHSLVPFLAYHYNTIHMIDLRYFNGDLFEYMYANNLNDTLILYNQNTFMTDTNLASISEISKYSSYTKVPDVTYGPVPEMGDAAVSYFDDAVFVGDSLTIGIKNFSGFNSTFLCMGGLNTQVLETDALPNGKTVMQSIKDSDHIGKLYIMLGANEIIYDKPGEFIERYSAFIDNVRKKFPDVIVYIMSIMPVTEEYSQTQGISNPKIVEYNTLLLDLAVKKQCYYVDLHSHFKNENGVLPDNIGSDGIHLGPEKYKELALYLQSHAVPEAGVVKIDDEKTAVFAGGGKADTDAIGKAILESIVFKDKLTKVSDALIVSDYKVDPQSICSASLYMGGGSTAEEVAVFEAKNEAEAKELESLAKQRIERKKKDFENYMPGEMPKLNNPTIVRKGNVVVVCIADSADQTTVEKNIK